LICTSINCSKTVKSNSILLRYEIGGSYKRLVEEITPRPDFVDEVNVVAAGNYFRMIPHKIGALQGALFVMDSADVITRMDWYLDSLPAWPLEISFPRQSRSGYSWRHASVEDYKYLADIITKDLGQADEMIDAENKIMNWNATHITLTYFGKSRSIAISKNITEHLFKPYNGFAFRSVYDEDLLPKLVIGKTRKEYERSSLYKDTIIQVESGPWFEAYTHDTLMGLPGLLFHDVHSSKINTLSTHTVDSKFANS